MTEQDLSRFLHKVDQLQQLVQSLEDDEQRRQSLAACTNHNQVVALARRWGFEIARRWGEPESRLHDDNLLQEALPSRGGESERILLEGDRWWLTLINSNEASTPSGEWMSQETFEWVLLLRGSACLLYTSPSPRD